jgi:hypothetical protein
MFPGLKYIFLLLASLMLSCKEPVIEPQKPDIYFGECSAVLNGEPWGACAYAKSKLDGTEFITVFGNRYNESQLLIETLNIINVPLEIGEYQFDYRRNPDNPYGFFTFKHVDLALADYFVQEGVEARGEVSLTRYDTLSREVEGYFDCVLYLIQKPGKPDAPDSLVFTDGYFYTRILE